MLILYCMILCYVSCLGYETSNYQEIVDLQHLQRHHNTFYSLAVKILIFSKSITFTSKRLPRQYPLNSCVGKHQFYLQLTRRSSIHTWTKGTVVVGRSTGTRRQTMLVCYRIRTWQETLIFQEFFVFKSGEKKVHYAKVTVITPYILLQYVQSLESFRQSNEKEKQIILQPNILHTTNCFLGTYRNTKFDNYCKMKYHFVPCKFVSADD